MSKAPARKRSAASSVALADAAQESQAPRWTTKQERYLQALFQCAERGQAVKQQDLAKAAGCSVWQVSEWNRDHVFRKRCAEIIRYHNEPALELLHTAVIAKGMQGSLKHAELAFRVAGRLDTPEPPLGDRTGGPQAGAVASVTFVGLPQPPTPQQAEAMRPPVGSNVIITPQLPGAGK